MMKNRILPVLSLIAPLTGASTWRPRFPILHRLLVAAFCWVLVFASESGGQITIPAKLDAGGYSLLLIPVTVDGNRFWCSLDSGGSAVFSLDENKGRYAGLQPTGNGLSAGQGSAVVRDQRVYGTTVDIAGVQLRNQTIVMRAFPAEARFDCVLGMALLRNFVVALDYDTPAVQLFRPEDFKAPAGAISIPITIERNNPYATATLFLQHQDRIAAKLLLDTGAGLPYFPAILTGRFIEENNVLKRVQKVAAPPDKPKATGGEIKLLATRIQQLDIGSLQLSQPVIALFQTNSGAGGGPDGLLAARFFRRFQVLFDYGRQQMLLKPGSHYSEQDWYDASGVGFQLDVEDKHYIVEIVVPNSPAAAAGIQEGDVLISLDGRKGDSLRPEEIRKLLSEPGREVVLRLRTNGTVHRVTLLLKAQL